MGTIQIDGSTPKLTIGNATAEDATILFDGNAQDFYIALDDSADDLLIGLGSTVGTTPAISIDENLAVKTYGDITMTGTTPTLTIGDAGAEDTAIVFDGNAQDFYIALDDSADDLLIGLGSTVGTTPAISIDENLAIKTYGDITMTGTTPTLTIGDAGAEDTAIVFDGNAKDFYVALDDSADKLVIGEGSTVGTNSILTITDDSVTIGDAAAVDTKLVFDGNAQDFYVGLDDSADDLVIGLGSAVGTTPAISINSDRDVTISDGAIDFDIASHDTSNGLKLGGTLVTATAAELNIMDGVTSTATEINLLDGGTSVGSSITVADADGFIVNDGGTMKTIPATDLSTYAGGAWTLIDSTDISSATANWTAASLSSSNRVYRLDFWLAPASASVELRCELNGTASNHDMMCRQYDTANSNDAVGRQHGEGYFELTNASATISGDDDEGIGGCASFQTTTTANATAYIEFSTWWTVEGSIHSFGLIGCGGRRNNGIISQIKLVFSSGDISHGWVRLFGRT